MCLRHHENAHHQDLEQQQPEHPAKERRIREHDQPGEDDPEQQKEALRDHDGGLGNDDGQEALVERRVAAEQPRLHRFPTEGGRRRRQVERFTGKPRAEQGAKTHPVVQEREAPAERVEDHDEHGREADEHAELPRETRDRREDLRGIVLGDEHAHQHDAEHEQKSARELHA